MSPALYTDKSKSDFLAHSTEQKQSKGMRVIDTYISNVVIPTCVNFFKGLLLPRGEASFKTINPDNVKHGIIEPPYFSDVMAEYVLTEILPLKKIYTAEHMLDNTITQECNNEQALSAIQEEFTSQIDYKKEFAEVWPKDHACAYERITKKGTKMPDIYLMSKQAAQKICKAKLLLIAYLSLTKVDFNNSDEITNTILKFSSENSLNISGQGLSSSKEKLVDGFMWVCTAFTDWLQIEAVYPSDVLATVRMLMPFEQDDGSDVILGATIPVKSASVKNEKDKKYLMELEERMYTIFTKQDLYPSDEALALTIGFLEYMSKNKDVAEKVIQYIGYLSK
jgi:hypothetical protein